MSGVQFGRYIPQSAPLSTQLFYMVIAVVILYFILDMYISSKANERLSLMNISRSGLNPLHSEFTDTT